MLIVTGSDDNYVAGVMVLIASAALHTPSARFAVIDMGISPENRARIDQLATRIGRPIERIEVGEESFADMPIKHGYLSRATYLRLLIPDLFPTEAYAVYMDCDMVVTDDLTPLSLIDLENDVIAAVADPGTGHDELDSTSHIAGTYVGAGLLVMNLSVWRKEDISQKCRQLLEDQTINLLWEDQSAINIISKGRIKYIPYRYNFYNCITPIIRASADISDPAVIHYIGSRKPWLRPCAADRIWLYHAEQQVDPQLFRRRSTMRSIFSKINETRKDLFRRSLEEWKFIRWANKHLNQTITRKCLVRAMQLKS